MTVSAALRWAEAHPAGTLPCPLCPATVKGENLPSHIRRTHADDGEGGLGKKLRLDGDRLTAVRVLWPNRSVGLPAPVTIGGLTKRTMDPVDGRSDGNIPGMELKAGTYLQVGEGRRSVVVRCATAGGARKCWSGWQSGPRRRRWHVTVSPAELAALQYDLAERGLLALRSAEG